MSESAVLKGILGMPLDQCGLCVCLASQLVDGPPTVFALNMTEDLKQQFRGIVQNHLERIGADVANKDLELRPFDAGYKADDHDLEWIKHKEINEITSCLACFPDPASNTPLFDGNKDFIKGLSFYAIILEPPKQERIIFFRRYSRQKEISQGKMFAALWSNGTYDRIRDPAFLFDNYIDCFARDGVMFIHKKEHFQQIFKFFEKLREVAEHSLEEIRKAVPISNFPDFADSCRSHLHKLTKLKNIANRPYWQYVTMADLKRTIKKFKLPVQVIKDGGKELLEFDPKHRWVILKLLDDDFLGSVMTKVNYEVNSKRAM